MYSRRLVGVLLAAVCLSAGAACGQAAGPVALAKTVDGTWRLTGPDLHVTFRQGTFNIHTDQDGSGTPGVEFVQGHYVAGTMGGDAVVAVRFDLPAEGDKPVRPAAGTQTKEGVRFRPLPSCSLTRAELLDAFGLTFVSQPRNAREAKRVGFDIDDTLLFSSPTFGLALKRFPPDKHFSKEFWAFLNANDEGHSVVKAVGKRLVALHKAEGAELYAITARDGVNPEPLQRYIEKTFGIPAANVFFEPETKAKRIARLGIHLYYGDSDTDIYNAIQGGAYGARILRSHKSSYRRRSAPCKGSLRKYHPGLLGEEIIANSYD